MTINQTAACVDQTMSNDHVNEVLCDDVIVRKKCLTTNIVNNVDLFTMMSFANANMCIKKHNNQPNLGACQSNDVE